MTDPAIDWNRILLELSNRGYSVRMISVEIDIPRSTLDGWKNIPNTEPRYRDGRRLIALWCEVTGRSETEIPAVILA